MTTKQLQEKMNDLYNAYVAENGKAPGRAECKVQFKDDGAVLMGEIALETEIVWEDFIFFAVDGIDGLCDLAESGDEDFIVLDIKAFYE